jgi:hypothetical protein
MIEAPSAESAPSHLPTHSVPSSDAGADPGTQL